MLRPVTFLLATLLLAGPAAAATLVWQAPACGGDECAVDQWTDQVLEESRDGGPFAAIATVPAGAPREHPATFGDCADYVWRVVARSATLGEARGAESEPRRLCAFSQPGTVIIQIP